MESLICMVNRSVMMDPDTKENTTKERKREMENGYAVMERNTKGN